MKTLADFKRDIKEGTKIQVVEFVDYYIDGREINAIPEKMKNLRTVTYTDTTGFYLSNSEEIEKDKFSEIYGVKKRGSFCGYPKAKNLEYNNDTFTIVERDSYNRIWNKRTYKIA